MEKRLAAAEKLLSESMERLTKQLELLNEMDRRGIDTTGAVRLLESMQQTFVEQTEHFDRLLRQHSEIY
jgi:hypothetical protein